MNDMEALHEIVAADKAARERTKNAAWEKDSFDERLRELGRAISEGAMERAQKEVDAARRQSESALARTLEELDRQCGEAMESMKARFAAKKDEGVETMFRLVVGLDD